MPTPITATRNEFARSRLWMRGVPARSEHIAQILSHVSTSERVDRGNGNRNPLRCYRRPDLYCTVRSSCSGLVAWVRPEGRNDREGNRVPRCHGVGQPNHPAVVMSGSGVTVTFRELDQRSSQLARRGGRMAWRRDHVASQREPAAVLGVMWAALPVGALRHHDQQLPVAGGSRLYPR